MKRLLCKRIVEPSESLVIEGDCSVLIDAGRVVYCGLAADEPPSACSEVVDLGPDSTAVPGLLDVHVHPFISDSPQCNYQLTALQESGPYKTLKALQRVQAYLHAGWTTVRIAGDAETGYGVTSLARAVNEGMFVGPTIEAAAHYLSIIGGGGDLRLEGDPTACLHPDGRIVTGPEEMRRAVREEIKFGSTWIKLLVSGAFMTAADSPYDTHFSREEVDMAVAEASRLSTPVMCHAHSVGSIRLSLEAGAKSIEHGTFIADDPSLVDLFIEKNAYLVPTLFIGDYYTTIRPAALASSSSDSMQKMVDLSRATRARHLDGVRLAHCAGIPICVGSDDVGMWPPSWSTRELLILQEAGLSAMDCLRAATSTPARMLGRGELGSLKAGSFADVIAVRGNPLDDLQLFETSLFFVMKQGRVVRHDVEQS